jgi:hypothetical protein
MIAAPAFQPLTGLYEPSAIQQLPNGRFLVLEDEKQHPFTLVEIGSDGRVDSLPLEPGFFEADEAFWKLDDLEGVAIDQAGYVYAVTSHSRDAEGDEKKSRNKLVRFRIQGECVVDSVLVRDLKAALTSTHPVLAQAANVMEAKAAGGLNIEALEITPDGRRLWIGFRSPLLDRRAILIGIDNVPALFEREAAPEIGAMVTLDLAGHGLRGIAWVPSIASYLLVSGPISRAPEPFGLWSWSGRDAEPARHVEVPGLTDFAHAEGICPALIDGHARIVVVSDDGDRTTGRYARYLILDPGQLHLSG